MKWSVHRGRCLSFLWTHCCCVVHEQPAKGPLRLRAYLGFGWGLKWVGVRRPSEPCCLRKVWSSTDAASAPLSCWHCSCFAVWTGLSSADSEASSTTGLCYARWSTDGLHCLFAAPGAIHYRLHHYSSQLHRHRGASRSHGWVAPIILTQMNFKAVSWHDHL